MNVMYVNAQLHMFGNYADTSLFIHGLNIQGSVQMRGVIGY